MQRNDNARRACIGTLTRQQLAALRSILEPYRAEPITPAVMSLAVRLARVEVVA